MHHNMCPVPGCAAPSSRFSPLCATHRRTQARHGHYAQTALDLHELKPYLAGINKRRKANPASPAWAILGDRWAAIVSTAGGILAEVEAGRAFSRPGKLAAEYVRKLAQHAAPEDIVGVSLAVLICARKQPHRFKSDRAVSFQLVRRVRGLADTHAGTYWSPKDKRMKRVYRDACPQAVEILGRWLQEAFGVAAIQLADLQDREKVDHEAAKRAELERLSEAIAAMA